MGKNITRGTWISYKSEGASTESGPTGLLQTKVAYVVEHCADGKRVLLSNMDMLSKSLAKPIRNRAKLVKGERVTFASVTRDSHRTVEGRFIAYRAGGAAEILVPSDAEGTGAPNSRMMVDVRHIVSDAPKFAIARVRVNRQGYDSKGVYFGIGAPVYRFERDGWAMNYVRAESRTAAKAEVRKIHPGARFA